jgi:hypothetical protein
MSGGSSHDRRKAVRANQQGSPKKAKFMSSTISDRKSRRYLLLSILWSGAVAVVITLIATAPIERWRVVVLAIIGAQCFSFAVHLHEWTKSRSQAISVFILAGIVLGAIGWQALPQPKTAVVEMQISPSSFPISIPPRSTTSILRLHPNIILSD